MTERSLLPYFYYPTTVVIVDDNKNFLKSMEMALADNFHVVTFDRPHEAIEFLTNPESDSTTIEHCLSKIESDYAEHMTIDINIRDIHTTIYKQRRFNEVAVVISDYAMPNCDGITFFKQLSSKNFMKILLTGEAGEDLAVKAFNENVINNFIVKLSADLTKQVSDTVKKLQNQYFISLSKSLINDRILSAFPSLNSLSDEKIVKYFEQVILDNNIIEFYICDSSASFIMLDKNGTVSWLVLHTEEELNDFHSLAKDADDVSNDILEALASKNKIPFFYTTEQYQLAPKNWGDMLHDAEKVSDNTYVCYIINNKFYDIDKTNFCSYTNYLDSLED